VSWLRFDDAFFDHPKIAGLDDRAFRWFMWSLGHCSRYLTDGFVALGVIRGCSLVTRKYTAERALRVICGAGLWEEVEGGIQIHDYLDFNPTRASVLKKRQQATERKRRSRANQKPSRHGVTNRGRVTPVTAPPTPSPKKGEEGGALWGAPPSPETTCVTCERDGLELSLFAGQWWCSGCLADYHRPGGLYENLAGHGGNNAQPTRGEAEA